MRKLSLTDLQIIASGVSETRALLARGQTQAAAELLASIDTALRHAVGPSLADVLMGGDLPAA